MESQNSHRAKTVLRNKNSVQEPPCLTSYYSNTKKKARHIENRHIDLRSRIEDPNTIPCNDNYRFFLSFKLKQSLILLYVYVCIHECA